MFLSLAYDVRKAYERQREIIPPPPHYDEMGVRYGVQILWPVLLLQQRMLRHSLAYLDQSAKTQAIAYALEAVIDEALREDFGAQGKEAATLLQRINPAVPEVSRNFRPEVQSSVRGQRPNESENFYSF
ncbi:MAG TPA: hypothetical protein VGX71_04910 [Pseudaminobacter sp.]|nr:hypothetical protein [Pseudaminobacter sp.]